MSWKKVKLGDIAEFSNGINFGKEAYTKGIKLIGVSNFANRFYPDYDELQEVREDIVRENDFLKSGDIVFVRSNGNKELVGRCMLIKEPPTRVTFSGFCIRARLKELNNYNPMFWCYHFKNKVFRRVMSGTAIGTNIQNLSQGRLAAYEADIPDFDTQNRIVEILSKYDELIENNNKQIKLLEETAQRLYKEWFLELRFPNHEKCKIIDGVPEGWKKRNVGEIIEKTVRSKQIRASDYQKKGLIPIIDQSRNFIAGYTNDTEALVKRDTPIIVFGDHTRVLKYIQFPFAKGADGTQLIVSNCVEMPQSLLYCSLSNIDLSNYHYARHFKYLKAEKILIPSLEIANMFDKFCNTIFKEVQCRRELIVRLSETRDRLLPKLMNGEIEIL